jgi:hypothetical protein
VHGNFHEVAAPVDYASMGFVATAGPCVGVIVYLVPFDRIVAMPRTLPEYSLREWRRLRPLVDRYKHARYQAWSAILVRRPPAGGDLHRAIAAAKGARVIVSVAFRDPDKIDLQAELVRRFVPGCVYMVADNSGDSSISAAVARTARRWDVPYVRLPDSPWVGLEGGRGHGLAMNWMWRHLLRQARPAAFGFIDHDIYPTRPTDPFAPLAGYPVAGLVFNRPPRWQLWAGFCFFRFDAVEHRRLDFCRDFLAGLDTGGGNWPRLYRHLDRSRVVAPPYRVEAVLPGHGDDECAVEWIGDWLHESHYRNRRRDLQVEKSRIVRRWLAAVLAGETTPDAPLQAAIGMPESMDRAEK